MANYPYISAQGALVKAFEQFRKSFPTTVDASTLKRFGIAPGNESFLINALRFLGLIDEGSKREEVATAFFYGGDEDFSAGMEKAVQLAYATLFDEYGIEAWNLDRDRLAIWFRTIDKTSEVIGGRQANTFQTLAALAGHGDVPKSANGVTSATPKSPAVAKPKTTRGASVEVKTPLAEDSRKGGSSDFGLTVRIEVNLPANGTPEAYDAIFASIRKNLIDPK